MKNKDIWRDKTKKFERETSSGVRFLEKPQKIVEKKTEHKPKWLIPIERV